jgi:hypothetical protein
MVRRSNSRQSWQFKPAIESSSKLTSHRPRRSRLSSSQELIMGVGVVERLKFPGSTKMSAISSSKVCHGLAKLVRQISTFLPSFNLKALFGGVHFNILFSQHAVIWN